jgi:hypothetical protein
LASEHSSQSSSTPGDIFATTHWTVVLAAGKRHTPESDHALEELCRTYWFPLYACVRRRGHAKAEAEDLTQAFFARFLEKNYLEGLSRGRAGNFRRYGPVDGSPAPEAIPAVASRRDRPDTGRPGAGGRGDAGVVRRIQPLNLFS